MRIVVVGAGKVGYNLAKIMYQHGHYISVIEKRQELCERLAEEIPVLVIQGDGTDIEVLTEAGCEEADVLVGVTGTDQENLVVCQVAKKNFEIEKTVARINNPKNEPIFKVLGVDISVSATNILAHMIEKDVTIDKLKTLAVFEQGHMTVVEIDLAKDSPVIGKNVAGLPLPEECVLIGIIRNGRVVFPRGNTEFAAGDSVMAVATNHTQFVLRDILLGGKHSGR